MEAQSGNGAGVETLRLNDVSNAASAFCEGDPVVDLSALVHDRATHLEIVPASVLAWWLLGTSTDVGRTRIRLPEPGSAALRHLARAGLLTAAKERNIGLEFNDGSEFGWGHLGNDAPGNARRIPGIQWNIFAGPDQRKMRILPRLADARCVVPDNSSRRLSYPWLAGIGLASRALSPSGYKRLVGDVDLVLRELIDNVHRWSRASSAFAVVSATTGGGQGPKKSWNRCHIVVADTGIGVPVALRQDVAAFAGLRSQSTKQLDATTDLDLVGRLLLTAFGARHIPNHNGHGLLATQIRAGRWIGAVDVFTVGRENATLCVASRGSAPTALDSSDTAIDLPAPSGTLVHVMLQGVDSTNDRHQAAEAEHFPFDAEGFDQRSESAFALMADAI